MYERLVPVYDSDGEYDYFAPDPFGISVRIEDWAFNKCFYKVRSFGEMTELKMYSQDDYFQRVCCNNRDPLANEYDY